MQESLQNRARHLYQVEGLSLNQVATKLGISRKKVTRLIRQDDLGRRSSGNIIEPYERLIQQWYTEYPFLQAIQVLQRLKSYGYEGGYTAVKDYTLSLRKKRKGNSFHALNFLPGEEAQVDWMQRRMPFGVVYGFVYIMSYSRYLYSHFYLRSSMEFFLDGHIEAFKEIKGVANRHTYDNLKSVVITSVVSLTVLYICLCERSEAISQLNKIATPDTAGLAMTSYLCDTTLENRRLLTMQGFWTLPGTMAFRFVPAIPASPMRKAVLNGLSETLRVSLSSIPSPTSTNLTKD